MTNVEFLVKLRDAAQAMADAANEQLERMTPKEVRDSQDYDKLFWENLEGNKGPFQRTSKKANQNSPVFQALQNILKEHKGFVHIGSYRYWFDRNDSDVIDRRKK